jgi:hypothetical protein
LSTILPMQTLVDVSYRFRYGKSGSFLGPANSIEAS